MNTATTSHSHHMYGSSVRSGLDADFTSDYSPSSVSSGFTSIETATKFHIYENGRRYQSFIEGRYPLPNDEAEQNREEIQHSMVKELLDGELCMAPIGDCPQKIIDLGTGCGLWAIEAADKYPSAHVLGVDLSPIQPHYAPPNVEWKIDDLEAAWPAAYQNADYIHAWSFLPTISSPAKLLSSALKHLRPGGWIEFGDILPTIHPTPSPSSPLPPSISRFFSILTDNLSAHYSWSPHVYSSLGPLLSSAGFTSISVRREKLPLGPPGGGERREREVGLYMQLVVEGLVGAVLARRRELGLEEEEARALAEDVGRELRDPECGGHLWWSSVWAQRPPR